MFERKQIAATTAAICSLMVSAVSAEDAAQLSPKLVDSVPNSIAWLDFLGSTNSNPTRATGFIVRRPSDGKHIIITAGHPIRGGSVVRARVPGRTGYFACDEIDFSETLDLMALYPRKPLDDIPALDYSLSNHLPKKSSHIWLFGHEGGLDSSFEHGFINADPLPAKNIQPALVSPRGDTMLIRHGAPSAEGGSGGPLIDRMGKVWGIQIGVVPKTNHMSFAVSSKHLADLELDRPPDPDFGRATMATQLRTQSGIKYTSEVPQTIAVGGQQLDVRCLDNGPAPRDADELIRRYIDNPDEFRESFTVERLQNILADTPVRRIVNPALDFTFLLPVSYDLSTVTTEKPTGIIATLTSQDRSVAFPYNTISIHAFNADAEHARAKAIFDEQITDETTPLFRQYRDAADEPIVQRALHQSFLRGVVVGMASGRFTAQTLRIRVRRPDGTISGAPDGEVYSWHFETQPGHDDAAWSHANYVSETGLDAHAVHCRVWGHVVVLIHYQVLKRDLQRLQNGQPISRNLAERMFIRRSVSLY